jgi:hypothetical protein
LKQQINLLTSHALQAGTQAAAYLAALVNKLTILAGPINEQELVIESGVYVIADG